LASQTSYVIKAITTTNQAVTEKLTGMPFVTYKSISKLSIGKLGSLDNINFYYNLK